MTAERQKRAGFVLLTRRDDVDAPACWVKIDAIEAITDGPFGCRLSLATTDLLVTERAPEILDRIAPIGAERGERKWLDPLSVEALAQFEGVDAPRGSVPPDTIRFLMARGLLKPAGIAQRRPLYRLTDEGLAQLQAATAAGGAA